MKVRQRKLLALLICAALSAANILPVGLSVSASELRPPNWALENDEETEQEFNAAPSDNVIANGSYQDITWVIDTLPLFQQKLM